MKKKILFVCIENSNRSQMSQAFAKIYGGNGVEAYSAGSHPSGKINPKAIASMEELFVLQGMEKIRKSVAEPEIQPIVIEKSNDLHARAARAN